MSNIVVSGPIGGNTVEDGGSDAPFAGIAVSDDTSETLYAQVQIFSYPSDPLDGALTAASSAGWTMVSSTTGTVITYSRTFSGAGNNAAAAQAALQQLVYQSTPGFVSAGDTLSVRDYAAVFNNQTALQPTNYEYGLDSVVGTYQTPSVTGIVGGESLGDTGSVAPFTGVTVTDADDTTLIATVTIAGGSGSFTPASSTGWATTTNLDGSVTYSRTFADGTGSAATAQSAIGSLVFQPAAHAMPPGTTSIDTLTVAVTSVAASLTGSVSGSVQVTAVHDPVTLAGSVAGQSLSDEGTTTPFAGVTITDPDDTSITVTARVVAATGSLTAASTAGWSQASNPDGSVTYTETFAAGPGGAAAAAAQSALGSLVFQPVPHALAVSAAEVDAFSVTATDGLGTQSVVLSGTDLVLPVHDAPTLSGVAASVAAAAGTSVQPLGSVVVADPDLVGLTASVSVAGGATGSLTGTAGWAVSTSGTTEVLTQSFAAASGGTPALAAQTAIRALGFEPAAGGTTTVSVQVTDTAATPLSSILGTTTVAATATSPVLGGDLSTAVADVLTAAPFAGLSVSEPDETSATLTVTVGGGATGGDLTAASTAGWTRTVSDQDSVYTLLLPVQPGVGTAVQSALGTLVFQPAAQAPGTSTTSAITVSALFGDVASPAVATATVTALGSVHPFATLSVQDADPNALVSVTVALPAGTAGQYVAPQAGSVGPDLLTYTVGGTAAQVSAALQAVSFVPDQGSAAPASYVAGVTGSGAQLVDAGTGDNSLAATANSTVMGGAGASTIYGAQAAPSVLVGGTGHSTFVAADGPTTVLSGSGGSGFYAGSSDAVMSQSSGQDTFYGGTGNASVYGGSGPTTVYGSTGSLLFQGGSGAATVYGGSGTSSVYGGASSLAVYAQAAGTYVAGLGGNSVVLSGQGASLLVGGSDGDQVVAVGSANDALAAGTGAETLSGAASSGQDTFFGGTGNATIVLGSASATVVGGPGSDTIFAGSGSASMTWFGGSGDDVVVGNAGLDTFVVGSGNETLMGGTGTNVVDLVSGVDGGVVTIGGFRPGSDVVNLFGYSASQVATAVAQETVAGGSTVLSLGDGTRVIFQGVTSLGGALHVASP